MDKKDLQIMEILAQNCRVPHTTIAQALKVSKDTITYKIKHLEKTEFIKEYVLFVDARKLGFTRYHILIKLDAGIKDKQELYDKISKHKFVMWMNSYIGRYDLQIIIDATDSFHLNKIREELFELCDNKIKEYFILTHLSDLEFTQLNPVLDLNTKFKKKQDHSFSNLLTTRKFPVNPHFERYEPTKIEIDILRILADNPKESLIDIGRKLSIDRNTVKKRITNLIGKKVILNFGGIPNLSKQGFVTYYLLVRVEQETPLEILKKPFAKLQNIFYAGRMIGDYDMILYLNARNPQELNSSIEFFKSEIESYIIHYDLLVQDKVHYWRQFTPGIYENLMARSK
ncbi:TPA: AsnC family transcriptional regulator [Candidatus Woesearchaeota archaeon]|nr:AsnC family transcriptional regulator [Candidatus Woesearchaeota archaeon]